ncbi:HK97 family phage major capsid protein OS=Dorea sp. 5-2 GN=C817_04099 PE=4 SV=1: Phage_capsid [Gemmata massiliana]|uniref:Phage capsid-like C-terminal domain-containing protein n=1 Tax=Gemmata massiliana TaxID=1210884 RepID=A0A6P2CYL9_9BACT|nr:phage major capsid protein [Gemmata massiliana]VTR94081.1 HK97 family phage major capsid protein OS=Dorea sp. 5-2 GN=C817_04099 PE=4 SV=1: Phage_capsid [Gemmata massiliana]
MSLKNRASAEEIQGQIDSLMQEADTLQAKDSLTPEEQQHLDELLSQIETLQSDLAAAQSSQRLLAAKERMQQPTRPAPKVAATPRRDNQSDYANALRYWMLSNTDDPEETSEAHFRTREHGFRYGHRSARLKCNYRGLNFKDRTILSKGGSGSGADWQYQTYSDQVVRYLTTESPIVGVVRNDVTPDGSDKTYFKVDNSSMMSTFTSASSGTETNPTIPDTNISSADVVIKAFDITSGYQKYSFNVLRDSHQAVKLLNEIAEANGKSHARKIEEQLFLGNGDGSSGIQGLLAVDHAISSVSMSNFGMDDIEDLYYAQPQAYRQNSVWACNDTTAKVIRQKLKDTTGRSLFDRNAIDQVEWDLLLDRKFYVSRFMPDSTILFFNPDYYVLRLVDGQIFRTLEEKFFPNYAAVGIMSIGGCFVGPTGASGAIHSLTITS